MTAILESQITLELLVKIISFSSSKRIIKVNNKAKIIEVGEVIYSIRNYCKIKITKDSIEQSQLVNDFIQKIEMTALKRRQDYISLVNPSSSCLHKSWIRARAEQWDKGGRGPSGRENLLYILPPPILGYGGA